MNVNRDGEHVVAFGSPFPADRRARPSDAPPAVRELAVHMNSNEPVARGEAVSEPMEGGRRVTRRMDSPPWTADYAFESIIEPNDSRHALTIRTLRR